MNLNEITTENTPAKVQESKKAVAKAVEKTVKEAEVTTSMYQLLMNYEKELKNQEIFLKNLNQKVLEIQTSNNVLQREIQSMSGSMSNAMQRASSHFLKETTDAIDSKMSSVLQGLDRVFYNYQAKVSKRSFWEMIIGICLLLDLGLRVGTMLLEIYRKV